MIEVFYQCACMPKEDSFHVKTRGADESIGDFMMRISRGLADAHHERSPLCMARSVDKVRIPVTDDGRVGGK
jgi:hypothetical protein